MGQVCHLVPPDVVRLELSGGDFLDVKRELNYGEQRKMQTAGLKRDGVDYVRDLEREEIVVILAYVLGWSFVDFAGAPLPFSEATITGLGFDKVREIVRALNAHVTAEDARRAELRANPPGASALRAIS